MKIKCNCTVPVYAYILYRYAYWFCTLPYVTAYYYIVTSICFWDITCLPPCFPQINKTNNNEVDLLLCLKSIYIDQAYKRNDINKYFYLFSFNCRSSLRYYGRVRYLSVMFSYVLENGCEYLTDYLQQNGLIPDLKKKAGIDLNSMMR